MIKKSFKEVMKDDVNTVFMNNDEFANIHLVNGKKMNVIFDSLEQMEREQRVTEIKEEGLYKKHLLIYVKKSEYGPLPAPGNRITLDRANYLVTDAVNEDGLYSISLEANKS